MAQIDLISTGKSVVLALLNTISKAPAALWWLPIM